MNSFIVIFLDQAKLFLDHMEDKARRKVLYNIWKSKMTNNQKLFSKLTSDIWEFRTKYLTNEIRFLAFWDKKGHNDILVAATHGFYKKSRKTPKKEIDKAMTIRNEYFK